MNEKMEHLRKARYNVTTILAFNSDYLLSAIFFSVQEAAQMTGALRQSLAKAAQGELVAVKKRYWRIMPPDFEIEPDDIGKLTLFDYDAAIGEDRRIYPTRRMVKGSVMLESEYKLLSQKVNLNRVKNL